MTIQFRTLLSRSKHLQKIILGGGYRLGGQIFSFAIVILASRALGPTGYGEFSYVNALIGLVVAFGIFGQDYVLIKETPNAEKDSAASLTGLFQRSFVIVSLVSVSLSLVIVLLFWAVDALTLTSYLIGLAAAPIVVLVRFGTISLQALGLTSSAQFYELFLRPVVFCVILGVWFAFALPGQSSVSLLLLLNALAFALVLIAAAQKLGTRIKGHRSSNPPPAARYLRKSLPFAFLSCVMLVYPVVFQIYLGNRSSFAEVGYFHMAGKIAAVAAIALHAAHTVTAPHISRLLDRNDLYSLESYIQKSALSAIGLTAIPFMILILAGDFLMSLFFGVEFSAVTPILLVITFSLFIEAFGGFGETTLSYSGHPFISSLATFSGLVVAIILLRLTIDSHGALGAAYSLCGFQLVRSLVIIVACYRLLGINVSAIPLKMRRG